MKVKNYEAPQIEVIEIEVEDAILSTSGSTKMMSIYGNDTAW